MFKKYLRILAYVKPYWKYALLNILFNLLVIVFSLVSFVMLIPFLNLLFGIEKLVETKPELSFTPESALEYLNYLISQIIISKGKVEALIFICLFLLGTFFLRNLFRFLAMFFLANVRIGAVKGIRNNIYKKILILPLSFYSTRKKGDIIARITTDVQEVEYSIMNYLEMIVRDPITVIAYFITLFVMSPQLTLFVLVLLPITGYIIGRIGRSLRKDSKIGQTKFAGLMAIIEETISGLRIIKAFTAIDFSNRRFLNLNNKYSKILIKIYRTRDLSSPLSEFLSSVVIIIVLWFGGKLVLTDNPTITAAIFITYIVIFSQIIPPAKTFATGFYSIQKGIASAERVFEILDAEEVIKEKVDAVSIKSFEKEIEYRNVFFKYKNEFVLKDINCTIQKGKIIALVGQSGGGKSTFVDLLPRFYDTTKGDIFVDGISLKDYNINNIRSLMGIVTQEPILFNDTIFNNIAFGKEDITEEDVITAAKIANAHEFIIKMEEGYQSNIGDSGTKLSGGQRQRLSIARAVLRNPPILILDEATSSLDTESERLVQDALAKVMSNRTSIVIAHRLSTIVHADEIIVLQKGKIVERGTHQVLLDKMGAYHKLYDLQTFK
ncbi:MAG: ATP-binding cassette domain-containing protein [Bacteroidetes bacterium]|nr:ATP-binding cassette domain-containing protein [Bacteroidota bacterium]MBL7103313.1 ATP-binding cassette domain-containing protein [Bacteroidales bacterium]